MKEGYLEKLTDQLHALNSRLAATPFNERLGLIETAVTAYEKQTAEELTNLIFKNTPEREDSLKSFLSRRWRLANTRLGYTAMPDNEANRLLITTACGLSDGTAFSALKLLMPTLQLESLTLASDYGLNGWDHNSENPVELTSQVERICQTHLLNEKADSLLPVYCLANLAEWDPSKPVEIINYYSDLLLNPNASCNLTNTECDRLRQHSEQTRAVFAALESWQVAASDQGSLYGQLIHLARHLYNNSADGFGQEFHAGAFGPTAIYAFFDYYFQLHIDVRQALPEALKSEIKLLLACVADYHHKVPADAFERFHENGARVAITLINTCLATRRTKLLDAIRNHEKQLSEIVLNLEAKASHVEAAIEFFNRSLETLRCALNQGAYKGTDSLPLTASLLKELRVTLQFKNLEDVQAFYQGLNEAEIQELHNNDPTLAQKIVSALGSLENLVMLLHALPPHKIKATFTALLAKLLDAHMIQDRVGALLASLNHEKIQLLWGVLVNNQAYPLTTSILSSLLQHLTPEQCEIVSNAISELQWKEIAKLLFYQNDHPNITGYETITRAIPKRLWAEIIKDACDIKSALCFLTLEQCQIVVNAIPAQHWTSIIKTARDIGTVLDHLSSEKSQIVVKAIPAQHWTSIIKTARDIGTVLICLSPPEQSQIVVSTIPKELWTEIIRTGEDVFFLYYLKPEQRAIVFNAVPTEYWGGIVKTAADVYNVFSYFTPEQHAIVFNAIPRTRWTEIIKTAYAVNQALQNLTPEQCRIVVSSIPRKHWAKIIKTADDVNHTLWDLRPEQRLAIVSQVDGNNLSLFPFFFTPLYNKFAPSCSLRTLGIFAPRHRSLQEAEAYARTNPISTTAFALGALLH